MNPAMLNMIERRQVAEQARSQPEFAVLEALREAKRQQGEHFRTIQSQLADFAGRAFSEHIKSLVSAVYKRRAERWNNGLAYHRYLAMVTMMEQTLAVMALRAPETYLTQNGQRLPENHPEVAMWREDERSVKLGKTLRALDRRVVRHRTMLLEVAWVKGAPRWLHHSPHLTHVVQDVTEPDAIAEVPFIFTTQTRPTDSLVVQRLHHVMWSFDHETGQYGAMLYDENGNEIVGGIGIEGAEDGRNPYGMHPFSVWRDEEPEEGEFWLPPREDWWTLQRWVCRMLMVMSHGADFQGFAVPVLKRWNAEEEKSPTISPDEPITTVGPEAEVEFKLPPTNLPQLLDLLEANLRMAAVAEGMPSDLWSQETGSHSFAGLRLQRHRLEERRQDHESDYNDSLREHWRAHKTVCNYHRPRRRYSDSTELHAAWRPVELPFDPFQDAQRRETEYRAGTLTPVDTLMERDSTLTREAAEELHERNLAINAKLQLGSPVAATAGGGVPRPPGVRAED